MFALPSLSLLYDFFLSYVDVSMADLIWRWWSVNTEKVTWGFPEGGICLMGLSSSSRTQAATVPEAYVSIFLSAFLL